MTSTVPSAAQQPCHTLTLIPPRPTDDAQAAGHEACEAIRRTADLFPEMRGELLAHARSVAAILRLGG
jgi:hypothetical protein